MTQMTPDQAMQAAIARHRAGRLAEAEKIYRQILAAQPNHADALTNFADVLKNTGRLDDAQAACRRVVALFPNSAEAHCNLGIILRESGKFAEAISALGAAISLKPELAEAHNDLGIAFRETGRLDDAVAEFQRAIGIRPEYCQAILNLGSAYRDQGRNDLALACYQSAVKIEPDNAAAHSGLIFAMHSHPDCDAKAILQEAGNWANQHERPLAREITPHRNDRSPYRRLRIGYLTPDFHSHASTCFLLPLLGNHNARKVEVFCYSGVKRPDEFTLKFQKMAHHWRDIATLSDAQVADQIRTDAIDILVDLNLHAAGNRLLIFARKPAPVQVTWLAYPGTSGMDTMDYRFTDPHLDPPGQTDDCYTEKSIRLPDTFWCYDPAIVADSPIDVGPPPRRENGFVTFGCFNNFAKMNDGVLELWGKTLGEIPRSRLLLMVPRGSTRQWVLGKFHKSGIDSARIEFAERTGRVDYFKLFDRVDIVLDTFPYTGHTTGFDAAWMGVPFVTLAGDTAVGRGGVSILSNLGMTDWIANNPAQYVAIAARWANDLAGLSELRAGLRQRMESSALMNGPKFAADVEAVFWQMWRDWCFRQL